MLYLRPQRVYKPSTYTLSDPNEFILDLTNATYRLRIETPRGTTITEDNSQITCYAHIFLKEDGSQLTERLKERGFRPTWLLDNKPIDSARVSEDGYKLTFETSHLPAILQTVTLQARDTDILLALTDDPMIRRLLQAAIDSGFRSSTLIETSEKLLDVYYRDMLINQLKQDLTESIKTNTDTLSELLKHPLTVSKDGYWCIWDALQKEYTTTQYKSQGEKGEPGDKGEKGDKPVITLDEQYRLLADGQLLSQQSLKGAKGDRGETGARGATGAKGADGKDGHSPNIRWNGTQLLIDDLQAVDLRGHRGATGAKGDKGDKPVITLDEQYRLLADGQLLSQQSLKGAKGDRGETGARGATGAKGADGKDGHSPNIRWNGTQLLIDDLQAVDLRGQRGATGATGAKGDKGDTPVMTLDSNLRLLADGKLLSPVSLRGEPGQSPNPEDVAEDVVDTSRFQQLLTEHIDTSLTSKMQPLQRDLSRLSSATRGMANELQSQLCERMVLGISDQGYLKVNDSCSNSAYDFDFLEPGHTAIPHQRNATREIRLTMYSDYEELEARVTRLTEELNKLQATNTITPISDADQRCESEFINGRVGRTIHPKYGDWILSSDSVQQNLSFAGLKAEIGRSIYIQTRKAVYLYANRHAFYGLPGDERRGVRIDQWLSHNTTYRFLRASSDTWFVTASSSPYPWT